MVEEEKWWWHMYMVRIEALLIILYIIRKCCRGTPKYRLPKSCTDEEIQFMKVHGLFVGHEKLIKQIIREGLVKSDVKNKERCLLPMKHAL